MLRTIGSLTLAFMALGACEVAELPGTEDARDTRDTQDSDATRDADDADSAGDLADGLVPCDPRALESGCDADQYCETTAEVCVDCVGYLQRCVGSPDRAQRETCPAPEASGVGQLEGGFFEKDPCGSGQVCVSDHGNVSCQDQVCEAGFATCVSAGSTKTCNASGTNELVETCDAGEACYTGSCENIRHNVLLVFDTSSSMWAYKENATLRLIAQKEGVEHWSQYSPLDCKQEPDKNPYPCFGNDLDGDGRNDEFPDYGPFPACDGYADDPVTLFTFSKNIFTSVVESALGGYSQFALQRFPQRELPGVGPSCGSGWYAAQEEVTGDTDARTTDGASWFQDHLGEVVVVPFPVRVTIDNSGDLLSWIDNRELLSATPTGCVSSSDCGEGGRCADYNGEMRCFTHSDPELRAISQTPLGKSLFYAGEYIRRFVRVDGKACTTDASCDSAGYLCRDAKCVDPYRKCKDDFIVLFTDGGESFFQQETDFFNPVVQAKRLAYGLDCTTHDDCRAEARCEAGKCLAPHQTLSDTPTVAGEGYSALAAPDGTPISIKTTVITLNSIEIMNARIAHAGGGASVNVSSGEPEDAEDFKAALKAAMSPNYKCRPEDIEDPP